MRFEQEFAQVNPKHEFLLRFFREELSVREVKWSDLTIRNLTKVRDKMLEECAANTVGTYCAIIKAFLAQYVDQNILPCGRDYKNALKVKKTPSEHITLTEEEMEKIEKYEPKSKTEREVKARFLCEY